MNQLRRAIGTVRVRSPDRDYDTVRKVSMSLLLFEP